MHNGSVSPIRNFFRNKWVWLVLVIDVVIIIFIVSLFVNKATETATISFNIAPTNVTIAINGSDNYKNNGSAYSFSPGTYEVVISHPDLDSKTITVDLEANRNLTVTTFLSKDNDFFFYTLYGNYGHFYKLASIASTQNNQTTDHDTSAEAFIKKYKEQYDLYNTELPITYSEYDSSGILSKYITVRKSYTCNITLCLNATIFDENDKEKVIELLRAKKLNVEDFEIEYKIY